MHFLACLFLDLPWRHRYLSIHNCLSNSTPTIFDQSTIMIMTKSVLDQISLGHYSFGLWILVLFGFWSRYPPTNPYSPFSQYSKSYTNASTLLADLNLHYSYQHYQYMPHFHSIDLSHCLKIHLLCFATYLIVSLWNCHFLAFALLFSFVVLAFSFILQLLFPVFLFLGVAFLQVFVVIWVTISLIFHVHSSF